jgi:hypothetical protein
MIMLIMLLVFAFMAYVSLTSAGNATPRPDFQATPISRPGGPIR